MAGDSTGFHHGQPVNTANLHLKRGIQRQRVTSGKLGLRVFLQSPTLAAGVVVHGSPKGAVAGRMPQTDFKNHLFIYLLPEDTRIYCRYYYYLSYHIYTTIFINPFRVAQCTYFGAFWSSIKAATLGVRVFGGARQTFQGFPHSNNTTPGTTRCILNQNHGCGLPEHESLDMMRQLCVGRSHGWYAPKPGEPEPNYNELFFFILLGMILSRPKPNHVTPSIRAYPMTNN